MPTSPGPASPLLLGPHHRARPPSAPHHSPTLPSLPGSPGLCSAQPGKLQDMKRKKCYCLREDRPGPPLEGAEPPASSAFQREGPKPSTVQTRKQPGRHTVALYRGRKGREESGYRKADWELESGRGGGGGIRWGPGARTAALDCSDQRTAQDAILQFRPTWLYPDSEYIQTVSGPPAPFHTGASGIYNTSHTS